MRDILPPRMRVLFDAPIAAGFLFGIGFALATALIWGLFGLFFR